jgi:pantothenate kinase type III
VNSFFISVDLGNTHEKAALLTESLDVLVTFELKDLDHIAKQYQLNSNNTLMGICSVKTDKVHNWPFKSYAVVDYFKDKSFLDMPVNYTETLGEDRLIQAYYLFEKYRQKVVLIDSGTFSTVDFVDIKGFNGGFILPGLGSILKSYSYGEQLHILDSYSEIDLEQLATNLPHDTSKAIESGALLTFLPPLYEVIKSNDYHQVFISGGNGNLVKEYLTKKKVSSEALIMDKDLIHKAIGRFVQKVSKT